MASRPKKTVAVEDLQAYLQALSENGKAPSGRRWRALQSYAELQYRRNGGGRCALCNTHVRHVVPVRATHLDGAAFEFRCLCTRCLEGEKAISRVVVLRLGDTILEFREGKRIERSSQDES